MLRRVSCKALPTAAVARSSTAASFAAASALRWQSSKPAKFIDPDMTHFRDTPTKHPFLEKNTKTPQGEWDNPMQAHVWTKEDVLSVRKTHHERIDIVDSIAYAGVKLLRLGFDLISGYFFGQLTPKKMLRRILFLETAAGIPGMVAGSVRHLRSLRLMKRDHGWIHTLLEEAENERMHMLVFMRRHQPGLLFRGAVMITQGIFWNVFFFSYLVSPRLCHRFVGYLEEEAVRTYTHIIDVMQSTDPKHADVVKFAKSPADEIAIRYWRLSADATMLDVMMAVRRDEANHRDVNHTFAGLQKTDLSPFVQAAHSKTAEQPPKA